MYQAAMRVVFTVPSLVGTPADVQAIGVLTVSAVFTWHGEFAFIDILFPAVTWHRMHRALNSISVECKLYRYRIGNISLVSKT